MLADEPHARREEVDDEGVEDDPPAEPHAAQRPQAQWGHTFGSTPSDSALESR